ncbi:MAG: corrinoid protein [Desulfobacterales bacterium]|nr:corrinoid protein [Desulfobacterales bacterium]
MADHIETIKAAVISGAHKEIEILVKKALDDNESPEKIIDEAMIAGMDVVGRQFSQNAIFVPEMLVAAVTMKKGLDLIKPLLKSENAEPKGTIMMCTVKGDVHDIGKNLVIMMLEGAGFTVINLGVDQSVETLIAKVKETKPDILGLSALLTTTMPEMRRVIESLEETGLRKDIKVMVGGAPVDAAFAGKIGADGYGKDAAEAVQIARGFIS